MHVTFNHDHAYAAINPSALALEAGQIRTQNRGRVERGRARRPVHQERVNERDEIPSMK
nr:hypothetical protein [Frondihabitans sp. PAMC 28766]